MSELQALREEYKVAVGKAPPPNFDAEKLSAKIAEAKLAVAESPAEAAAAVSPPAPEAEAAKPAPEASVAAPAAPSTPHNTCFVTHPEKIGVSFAGHSLEPDKNGKILVSVDMARELEAHGFQVASE